MGPSSLSAANYMIAVLSFFKSGGGSDAALSQCLEFLWHARGYGEHRRGLLGVEVLNF